MATVFTCEHPVKVWNKYTKEFCFVPCRKCSLCKASRAQFWTDKLNREAKCHPYVLFGTLTYAPEFLPYLSYDSDHEVLASEDGSLSILTNGKIKEYLDDDSLRYYNLNGGCLPYLRFSDAQGFIKRLRSRLRTNPSGERADCRYIRYMVVGELGSTKLRPHFHFLIFTGSKWLAENATSVVSSCWSTDGRCSDSRQLGRIDVQLVKNSASSYVASYITCVDSIPKVYTFPKLRPRAIFSKHPPLGSLLGSSEEVRQLFSSRSVYRTVRGKDGEVLQCLWPKDLCDRLYPRVFGFGRVSHDVLRGLYDQSERFVGMSFDEFFWYCEAERLKPNTYRSLQPYFEYLHIESLNSDSNSLYHHLLSDLKRFCHQSCLFGIEKDVYFDWIEDYWERRDLALLNMQCEWQERVSNLGPEFRDFALVKIDSLFCEKVSSHSVLRLSDYFIHDDYAALSSACSMSESLDKDFVNKLSTCNKIMSDGKNKHIKYEYLNSDRIDNDLKDFFKYLISNKVS